MVIGAISPILDIIAASTIEIPGLDVITGGLALLGTAAAAAGTAGTAIKMTGDAMQGHYGDMFGDAAQLAMSRVGTKGAKGGESAAEEESQGISKSPFPGPMKYVDDPPSGLEPDGHTWDHLFKGDFNSRGAATGYHHRPGGIDQYGVKTTQRTVPDANGIYTGTVTKKVTSREVTADLPE